jgi:branched-chain amino acid transport system substrate-binding protein
VCLGLTFAPLASRSADPYPIYVLLAMTGSGSFFAPSQQQSLRAIEDDVNRHGGIQGRQIKFVIQDDQSNPQVDVSLAAQIFEKHVPLMLGPTLTSQCNAIIPMAVKDGPATWCFTPGPHPPNGGYVFGFGADTSHTADVSLRYLAARGITRVATISTTDATGQDGDRSVEAAAAKEKVTLVAREHFNPTDVSVSAQIARIKGTSPQALVVWTTGTPFGTVLRSLRDVGLDVPVLSTNGNITRAQMKQYGPLLPKELLFPGAAFLDPSSITDSGVKAAVKTFYDGVRAQGGSGPDWGNNDCYDGARLFVEALKKYGLNATPQQIRDYVHSLRNWPGVNGRYDFEKEPQRGLGDDSIVMVRWDAGKDNWIAISKPGGAPL